MFLVCGALDLKISNSQDQTDRASLRKARRLIIILKSEHDQPFTPARGPTINSELSSWLMHQHSISMHQLSKWFSWSSHLSHAVEKLQNVSRQYHPWSSFNHWWLWSMVESCRIFELYFVILFPRSGAATGSVRLDRALRRQCCRVHSHTRFNQKPHNSPWFPLSARAPGIWPWTHFGL